jgi:nucleoside phosphorylase
VESERLWDIFLEEASKRLKVEESNFHRPFIKTDRLFYTNPDSTVVEVEHPPADKHYFEGRTNVRFGPIASGKHVAKDGKLRKIFARTYGVRAYDAEADAVLESLEGNRNESFLIIRDIADYTDGSRKEWQPYSSMAAAAYMKTLIMDL